MSRGFNANRERQELIGSYGKMIGKRASFRCEWCDGTGDLRVWDYRPAAEPTPETLALLCGECRDLAGGRDGNEKRLHSLRNALWSTVPAISEGAAGVLARSRAAWVREAIEESMIDEAVKRELLG